jgi:CRP-like cAMP-binding protein
VLHDDLLAKSVAAWPASLARASLAEGERRLIATDAPLVDGKMVPGDLLLVYAGGVREFVQGKQGRELVIGFHASPAAFVIDELKPDENPRATRLAALGRAHLLYVRAAIVEACERDKAVVAFTRGLERGRLRRALRSERRLAFEPAAVRCADMLLELTTKFGVRSENGLRLIVPLMMNDLARYLCLTPRHLRRFVPAWEKQGVLRRTSEHIEILDLAALRQLASPVNSLPSGNFER